MKSHTLLIIAVLMKTSFVFASISFVAGGWSADLQVQKVNPSYCNSIMEGESPSVQFIMPERGVYVVELKKQSAYFSRLEAPLEQFKEDLQRDGYFSYTHVGDSEILWSRLHFTGAARSDGSFQITIQDPVEIANAEKLFGPKADLHVPRAILQLIHKLNNEQKENDEGQGRFK